YARAGEMREPALAAAAVGYAEVLRWLGQERDPLARRGTGGPRGGAAGGAGGGRPPGGRGARAPGGGGAAPGRPAGAAAGEGGGRGGRGRAGGGGGGGGGVPSVGRACRGPGPAAGGHHRRRHLPHRRGGPVMTSATRKPNPRTAQPAASPMAVEPLAGPDSV